MRLPAQLLGSTLIVITLASAAFADSFSYDFKEEPGGHFTYTSPILIRTRVTFTPTTCALDSMDSCNLVTLDPVAGTLRLDDLRTGGLLQIGPGLPTSFFELGTHSYALGLDPSPAGTLTISDIPEMSSLPEPASVALLSTGLLALTTAVRRRALGDGAHRGVW